MHLSPSERESHILSVSERLLFLAEHRPFLFAVYLIFPLHLPPLDGMAHGGTAEWSSRNFKVCEQKKGDKEQKEEGERYLHDCDGVLEA